MERDEVSNKSGKNAKNSLYMREQMVTIWTGALRDIRKHQAIHTKGEKKENLE